MATKKAIEFYKYANQIDNQSRCKFIETNELKLVELTNYLCNSQMNKIYMLFYNYNFYKENVNLDDYRLISYKKEPTKYRFKVNSKSGKQINVLLRWKNGNGIAFPAFQISYANKKRK